MFLQLLGLSTCVQLFCLKLGDTVITLKVQKGNLIINIRGFDKCHQEKI